MITLELLLVNLVRDKILLMRKTRKTFSATPRDPQVNVVREGRPRAKVLDRIGEGGGIPPLFPNQGAAEKPRQSVFDRISNKGSDEEVDKRLKSKMMAQLDEMLKMMGHSGSSFAVALVKDSKSPFAEHI